MVSAVNVVSGQCGQSGQCSQCGRCVQWSVMITGIPVVPSPCPVLLPSMLKLLSHRHCSDDRARRNTHIVTGRLMSAGSVDHSTSVSLQHQLENVEIANALQLEAAQRRAIPIPFIFVSQAKFELAQPSHCRLRAFLLLIRYVML